MILQEIFRDNFGFTLVELLVVIGITLLLAASASPIYSNLQVSSQLNDTEDMLVQMLRTARVRSVSGLGNYPHGLYFDIDVSGADSIVLYQGDSYVTRNTDYDRTEHLDGSISLTSSIVGDEVNFSKGLGRASATGTVTIIHGVGGTREISVNVLGGIESN